MKQLNELYKKILIEGDRVIDRTGVGTTAIFGEQIKFDLTSGFPAVTTKKLAWKSVVSELLWFLKGSTNVNELRALLHGEENRFNLDKKTIWDANYNEQGKALGYTDGELGPVYGAQWARREAKWIQPVPKLRNGVNPTYLGVASGSGKENHPLKKTWEGMIARCYDVNNISYHLYGGKGVFVCDAWLEFIQFAHDVTCIPGWDEKSRSTVQFEYQLDKDIVGDGYEYSPAMCMWATAKQNADAKNTTLYTVEKNGVEYSFTNIVDFCVEHGAEPKNFSDLWTGAKNAKTRNGFKLVRVENSVPDVRVRYINQIKNILERAATNPECRRLIVNAWNPAAQHLMTLPPCHYGLQIRITGEYLDLLWIQRSVDSFLGLPFNIASYALLQSIFARILGKTPRYLTGQLGDTHIYNNHIEQVSEQLSREPFKAPTLMISPGLKTLEDFENASIGDFILMDYQSHDAIKADMAV